MPPILFILQILSSCPEQRSGHSAPAVVICGIVALSLRFFRLGEKGACRPSPSLLHLPHPPRMVRGTRSTTENHTDHHLLNIIR